MMEATNDMKNHEKLVQAAKKKMEVLKSQPKMKKNKIVQAIEEEKTDHKEAEKRHAEWSVIEDLHWKAREKYCKGDMSLKEAVEGLCEALDSYKEIKLSK